MPGVLYLSYNYITFWGLNIYRFEEGEKIDPYYKIVNDVNAQQFTGKFLIIEGIPRIVYHDSLFCGPESEILTKELIQNLLEWYEDSLDILFRKIFEYTREEK